MGLYTDVAVAADFINEPIRPIADSISVDVRKVVLGNLLYHDTRLSADNTVSCASCHGLIPVALTTSSILKEWCQLGGRHATLTVYQCCL